MKTINYNDAKRDGKTLYRYKGGCNKYGSVVIETSGYIRYIFSIKATTGMPILKKVPDGTHFGTCER